MKRKVIIIGGGIGGLATANLLQKAGYDVSMYEKNDQLGGRAGLKKAMGFSFDTGPSWYLMPGVFKQYFDLFGLSVNKELGLKKLKPAYKVFYESHQPITITGNQKTDSATFERIEPGAGKALARYVEEGNHIYRFALKHFLYTNFNRPLDLVKLEILRQGPPMLKLLATSVHSRVKSFVSNQALQQILEYPMVFLGSSPFKAPAMYSLMSALDFKEGVYYPKEGIYSIIQLLEWTGRELGVSYKLNTGVKRILHKNGHATGILLETGEKIDADIVISNADLHFTETKLLSASARSYPAAYWGKREPGISALLIYLGIKGSLPQLEHHNLFFVDKWKENFRAIYKTKEIPKSASLYVCKPSATDTNVAPKGHENVFVLVPLPAGVKISKIQTAQLTERFIEQLSTSIDQPDLKDRIVFQESFGPGDFETKFGAWQGTALGVSHLLKQSAFWRTPNKSKKLDNLFYVGGNTVPGVGLPMCLISAELVYKRIMGIKRGGALTAIEKVTD
ncbi:MAG: phytoene desaturase family protein [Candidatus Saccharimonadales bacterium]